VSTNDVGGCLHWTPPTRKAGNVPVAVDHLLRTPGRVALAGLVVAVACMLPLRAWRIGRLAITALHEAGHAFAVLAVGGRVRAVHLRADTSGLTWHQGVQSRGGRLLVAAAGYPAPGLAGLAGAGLVATGHPSWWLAALALLGAIEIVLWVRNFFGLVITVAAVGALCCCLAFAASTAVAVVAAATVWYVALGGLRASVETRRERGVSDAGELARATRLPAGCFRSAFVLVAALSAAGCALVLFQLSP